MSERYSSVSVTRPSGTTSRTGSPRGPLLSTKVNFPIASWTSCAARGCSESYVHRVRPSGRRTVPTSRPLATALSPGGVVMWNVTGARRLGWSFAGKIMRAPSGCAHTTVPSEVGTQP